MILTLLSREYKNLYQGSVLGFVWAHLQPLLFILLVFSVFQWGFKGSSDRALYLTLGMIYWQLISQVINSQLDVYKNYGFMLKKHKVNLYTFPIVKILLSYALHLPNLIIILLVSNAFFEINIQLADILLSYAITTVFAFIINFLIAIPSMVVIDIRKLISLFLQFGVWLNPIFWKLEDIPEKLKLIYFLNPIAIMMDIFRSGLINEMYVDDITIFSVVAVLSIIFLFSYWLFSKANKHIVELL